MRLTALAFSLTLVAAGLGMLPAFAQVPCGDSRGCPNLTTDAAAMTPFITRESFPSNDCAVVEGMVEPGTRTLLRFNFVTPNHGPGDLIVGDPTDHPEWFTWSPCHGHYHFDEYADYRLWTLADWTTWDAYRTANPDETAAEALDATGLTPVQGRKQGFCVVDIAPRGVGDPIPKYLFCDDQGITVGWADAYFATLDGQWVDITGLPHGAYVLEAEVNAERLYVETDYADNRAWHPIVI